MRGEREGEREEEGEGEGERKREKGRERERGREREGEGGRGRKREGEGGRGREREGEGGRGRVEGKGGRANKDGEGKEMKKEMSNWSGPPRMQQQCPVINSTHDQTSSYCHLYIGSVRSNYTCTPLQLHVTAIYNVLVHACTCSYLHVTNGDLWAASFPIPTSLKCFLQFNFRQCTSALHMYVLFWASKVA